MKDTRQPLKPRLLDLIAEGREAAAAPFKPETLRETLSAMAKLGFDTVRISPAAPVDVRQTATAKAGRDYLARESIENDWESGPVLPGNFDIKSLNTVDYYELIIRLHDVQK